MAKRELIFRITATVSKLEKVFVDDDGLSEDEVEDLGRELAHQQFSCLNDGTEEKYNEQSELVTEKQTYEIVFYNSRKSFNERLSYLILEYFEDIDSARQLAKNKLKSKNCLGHIAKVQSLDREEIEIYVGTENGCVKISQ